LEVALTSAALIGSLVLIAPPPMNHGEDLVQDYVSARAILAGVDPYQPLQPLRERMQLPTSEQFAMRAEYNPHPPLCILLTAPLTSLSFDNAFLVCRMIQILLLAIAWVWGSSLAGVRSLAWSMVGGLVLGVWPPVWGGLDWGQPTGLIAFLSVGLFHLAGTRRPAASGALLAVACSVRPFYAGVAGAAGGWKARDIAVAALAFVAVAAGLFLAVGISPWEWFRRASTANTFASAGESLPSILGMSLVAAVTGYVAWFVFVTVLARVGLPQRHAAALGLTGGMLWYPLAWFHYDVALIPIALWAGSIAARQRAWIAVIMVVGYVASRFTPPYPSLAGTLMWIPVCGRLLLLGACGMICIMVRSPPRTARSSRASAAGAARPRSA
jgi:hypothetical protein